MESLRQPPIAFAHRGASADAPPNTLEAFGLALALGATGLESDVWLTADGVAVLDHDGVVRQGLRRHRIGELERGDLPAHIPSLEDLYTNAGTDYELSLDVLDIRAVPAILTTAAAAHATARLWLCHPSWELLATWHELSDEVHLVDSTRLRRIAEGPERRAARLADAGIDAINLHHTDWTGGLTTLFHRFERLAFGWDAQHPHSLEALAAIGIDGVYSDHVDRMVEVLRQNR